MLESTYLPFHLKYSGYAWVDCVTACEFVLFEVPPSKMAVEGIFSDSVTMQVTVAISVVTVREGRGCPETSTYILACLNVPSFGIADPIG